MYVPTICDKNTIDIRTLYKQIDHEYVIGTVAEIVKWLRLVKHNVATMMGKSWKQSAKLQRLIIDVSLPPHDYTYKEAETRREWGFYADSASSLDAVYAIRNTKDH